MSAPDYNVNREPAVFHCDDFEECPDPAHRIGAYYQTHDVVNVEIYDADGNFVEVHAGLSEPAALALMIKWIGHQRHDAEVQR